MEQFYTDAEEVSETRNYWNRWRIALIGIFVITFLATLLVYIFWPGALAVAVELYPVKMQDVSVEVFENATVIPTPEVPVMCEQVGWINSVVAEKGQRVKAGQLVATLQIADNITPAATEAYQTALQNLSTSRMEFSGAQSALSVSESDALAARARLARAQAELVAAQNAERLALSQQKMALQKLQDKNAQLQQAERLLGQGAVSRTELENIRNIQSQASSEAEQAQQALDDAHDQSQAFARLLEEERLASAQSQVCMTQAQAQVRTARSRMQNQQSTVQQTETLLRNLRQNQKPLRLKSPVDGVVSEVPAKPGTLLTPAMLVVRIKRPDIAVVVFTVIESEAKRLKKGMSAIIELRGKERTFSGRLSAIAPGSGAQGHCMRVVIDVPRSSHSLKPGNNVIARISYAKRRAAVIPISAVVRFGKGTAVWIVRDGVAHLQQVKLVQSSGSTVIVTEGLKDQDYIITSAAKALREGSRVVVKR